jgi:hypothetical protein
MWISTNVTNIYLASIRFGTLQYLCNTLYKSQGIPVVLSFLPYKVQLRGVFGINIKMKVIDLEVFILSIWLDPPMIS